MAIKKFGATEMEQIREIEAAYNLKLPKDYIDFLLEYNGGAIEKDEDCEVYIDSLHNSIHVDVLFGINTVYENANINNWMTLFKDDILKGTLIIGDSIEHGFIVLVCTEKDLGICYWDHTYEFTCSNDESNTYFIADTFTEFINHIK
jgi:SMI1 / KNR4 family.